VARRGRPVSVPRSPEGHRISALMEIYNLPTPTEFAKAIGVSQPRLSNVVASGLPLGKEMAIAIVTRFPEVDLDFLLLGDPTGLKSLELAEKLRQYARRERVELFTPPSSAR
jgi:plasmid maintenance system antidote protein VapI